MAENPSTGKAVEEGAAAGNTARNPASTFVPGPRVTNWGGLDSAQPINLPIDVTVTLQATSGNVTAVSWNTDVSEVMAPKNINPPLPTATPKITLALSDANCSPANTRHSVTINATDGSGASHPTQSFMRGT
jgi:hypothetical protein